MRLRTTLFLIAAVVAGLFWSLGSNVHAAVAHFIAPPLFGIAVAALWQQSPARRQFLSLLLFLGATELVRLIIYCVRANGWHYISGDSKTQLALATSVGLQLVIGIAAWGVARVFFRRHETRTA
jgi:hypothetical protein